MSVLFPFVVVRSLFCYIMHLLPCFVICICYPVLLYAFFYRFVACLVICICYPLVLGRGLGGGKGVGSVRAIQCFIHLFCLADLVILYFRYNCFMW